MSHDEALAPCTLCTLQNTPQPPHEKSLHLFKDCPQIQVVRNSYLQSFMQRKNLNWSSECALLGARSELSDIYLFIINTEIHLVNFYIYNCKRLKKLPSQDDLEYHLKYYREILCFSTRYKREWLKWEI